MRNLSQYLPPLLFSWIVTFTLASICHSQFNVNELIAVGVQINGLDRLTMTIDDWVGLLPTYGIILIIGLSIAFSLVLLIFKLSVKNNGVFSDQIKRNPTLILSLAGALAIAIVLLAMKPIMNITLIAGARELGFYAQVATGAVGGGLFAKLTARQSTVD